MNNSHDKHPTNSLALSAPVIHHATFEPRIRSTQQLETLSRQHLALARPRDLDAVCKKLIGACGDTSFASGAYYWRPGPLRPDALSRRFAELALQLLGNTSIDIAPEGEDDQSLHYRMTVTDMENNSPVSETFRVGKVQGTGALDASGHEILVTASPFELRRRIQEEASEIRRGLVLSMLPGEARLACIRQAHATLAAAAKRDLPFESKQLLAALGGLGADAASIKEYLGRPVSTLTTQDLIELHGICTLIGDGLDSWERVLESKRGAPPPSAKEDPPKARASAKKATRSATERAPRGGRRSAAAAPPPPEPKPEPPPKPSAPSRRDEEDDDDPPSSDSAGTSSPTS